MAAFPPLDTFGSRIIVCGPSNSGKSTLCVALGARLGVPAIHLDRLAIISLLSLNTNRVKRPDEVCHPPRCGDRWRKLGGRH